MAAALQAAGAHEPNVPYPGEAPGKAEAAAGLRLKNAVAEWVPISISFNSAPKGAVVRLSTEEGNYTASALVSDSVVSGEAAVEANAACAGARVPGKSISGTYDLPGAGVQVSWRAELRDGSHYMRRVYTLTAERDVVLTNFTPVVLPGEGWTVCGRVPGSPLVNEAAGLFCGVELPVAQAKVQDGTATIGFDCKLPLAKGQSVSFSTVEGVFPKGQLRRAFLAYLDRERAVPYHPVVQYNCWYDHGLNPTEQKMLDTVEAYGRELVQKRGVKLDSFVLDDGWDDFGADLWQPNPKKFPQGFGKLVQAIRGIDSHFGIWISPLGGYSGQKERTEHAKRMGLLPQGAKEPDLAAPGYRAWFLQRCSDLMQKDGVNFFKWDRAGSGVSPHFMALLDISKELRKINPDLFLSTTVGTWPSPFWLNYVDCTWRTGSADVNWCGKGNNRERYINYRDRSCYDIIVKQAPLYPLNSIMHHGIVLGTEFQAGHTSDARVEGEDPTIASADQGGASTTLKYKFPVNNNLRSDARILFASGANQQELYLTPGMMNDAAWDDVAAALKWSHKWAPVLADTHWAGGDPGKDQIYGYAAWRADRGATLALRNPLDKAQEIELSAAVFEPTDKRNVVMRAAYPDQRVQNLTVPAEGTVKLTLQPFEVLVFEADFTK